MKEQITKNLYEFWSYIGEASNKFQKTENYSAILMKDSDWPNRVFDVKLTESNINEIAKLSYEGKLAKILTIGEGNNLTNHPNFKLKFEQKNMAIEMEKVEESDFRNPNIKQVLNKEDTSRFSAIATEAFGYKVDENVAHSSIGKSNKLRIFLYRENNINLGCGIIFFDSNHNAGLHMIGTIPAGRGKGVGSSITKHLLQEAKREKVKICVLHASLLGEPIYRKLGFTQYGEIQNYLIL